jgi:hypothetical protein
MTRYSPFVAAALLLAAIPAAGQLRNLPPPNNVGVSEHGATVAALPDINGDGIADIAVGGGASSGNSNRIFIYSGANGSLIRVLYPPYSEPSGYFGHSISAVPDTNGDGIPDIAVGAPNHAPGNSPSQAGRVYLYSGATGELLHRLIPAFPVEYGQFGYSVAGIADVNGDGRGDIVVGAPYERSRSNSGSWSSGRVHIYSGATGKRIRTLHSVGEAHDGHFGHSVAVIPDVNGDGKPDILIGSPRERPDRSGRAYIYNSMGGLIRTINPPFAHENGRFGDVVAAVPDTDGDGIADFIVGAPRQFSRQGRAYLYSGATGQHRFTFASPSNQNDGRFGKSVSGMPDFNGDGRGDVVVGAYHEMHGGSRTGRAYIFSGATGQLAAFVITNSGHSEELGHSVAGMPDTNGNGKGEVAVGAPDRNPSGMAYHFAY